MPETLLSLSGTGIPPWSARGARQTIAPDVDASMERDVNGNLQAIPLPAAFHKYRITISCSDLGPPAFGSLKRGDSITVSCITELGQKITLVAGVGSATFLRDAVAGSGRAVAATGAQAVATLSGTGNRAAAVNFGNALLAGDAFIYYRPVLSCRVEAFNCDKDEYGAITSWSLELREV